MSAIMDSLVPRWLNELSLAFRVLLN